MHATSPKFIDSRNELLWNILSHDYNITIENSADDTFGCFTKSKRAIIFIPYESTCKDSFTHELLHIYLKQKMIFIGEYLARRFQKDEILSEVFSELLIRHIGNCLDHLKMVPKFLSMGFDGTKFLYDYDTPKCSDDDCLLLSIALKRTTSSWKLAADFFLGKYFGMKSCPNNLFNYSKHLEHLQDIDNNLFSILESFWMSWEMFDIENNDPVVLCYEDFCDVFLNDLKEWTLDMKMA